MYAGETVLNKHFSQIRVAAFIVANEQIADKVALKAAHLSCSWNYRYAYSFIERLDFNLQAFVCVRPL